MKLKMRLLCLLLAVVMVVGLVPTVMAEDGDDTSSSEGTAANHEHIHTTKNLVTNDDGTYTLRLESFLEGDPTTKERIPTDMVLVLDQSTSMSFCMQCGKDIDVRSILEHHKTYYVNNPRGSGRTPVYYCPGTNYGSNCGLGHTDGGWFSNNHASAETESQGDRFVPSIADGPMTYSKKGGNRIFTRVFYTTSSGDTEVNLWIETSKQISTTDVYFRKSGNNFIKLKYCANHAAWHDADKTCTSADNDYGTLAYWVPTAKAVEVTHGTTRFYLSNSEGTAPVCQHTTGNRYQALMDALSTFTSTIFNYSTQNNLKNRMAIVTFGGGNAYTRLLSVPNSGSTDVTPINQNSITVQQYQNSLQDVSTSNGQAIIQNAIAKVIDQGGGTHTASGLDIANNIFANNAPLLEGETKRNRIVIVFTDGRPEQTVTGDNYNGADTALSTAYSLRNSGANIYSIGVFPDADSKTLAYVEQETQKLSSGSLTGKASFNKFMHLLSSNYTGTTAPTLANTYNSADFKTDYYMSAANPNELQSAFLKIAENINNGSVENFDASTLVKDVITPYFQVDNSRTVRFHTEICTGKDSSGKYTFTDDDSAETQEIDALINKKTGTDDRTIEVDGFDFAKYYVAIDDEYGTAVARGRQLVIEIPIEPNPDFLGGDNVTTNTPQSGIYSNGTIVEAFPVPEVDINVSTIIPAPQTKNIYLSQTAALPELANIGKFSQNGGNYQVNGINNAYVDIIYTIRELNVKNEPVGTPLTYEIPAGTAYDSLTDLGWGDTVETHPLLKNDAKYKVTIEVVSINNENGNKSNEDAVAEILVYKPEITFKDSSINLGQTANYADNGGTVKWKHNGDEAPDSMGTAPTLEYAYTPTADAFKKDTPVEVTVTAKGNGTSVPVDQDITQYVTFWRDACDFQGCTHKTKTEVNANDDTRVNFVVHLKSFDLTISKAGAQDIDENQSFVFRITDKETGDYVMDVVVVGNGSVTIKNLPAGVYTVTEITDWSHRYGPEENVKEADAAKAVNGVVETPFTNTRDENKWLSGDSYCENWWGGSSGTAVVERNASNQVIVRN